MIKQFTGKHWRQNLFLTKLQTEGLQFVKKTLAQAFSREFWLFLRTPVCDCFCHRKNLHQSFILIQVAGLRRKVFIQCRSWPNFNVFIPCPIPILSSHCCAFFLLQWVFRFRYPKQIYPFPLFTLFLFRCALLPHQNKKNFKSKVHFKCP